MIFNSHWLVKIVLLPCQTNKQTKNKTRFHNGRFCIILFYLKAFRRAYIKNVKLIIYYYYYYPLLFKVIFSKFNIGNAIVFTFIIKKLFIYWGELTFF